jgi:nicotinic acid phosphoribosyltransferase
MKNNIYSPKDFFAVARDEAEVNNLLNTDIYKFMMLDFVLANPEWKNIQVKRKMTIRSKGIKTAFVIPESALIEQLEATKNIS